MSPLPSKEYIEYLKEQVKRFDRKGIPNTCFHEELAAVRKEQAAERKEPKKEIEPDGE